MPRTHPPYPPEFRAEAVRLGRGSDTSIPALAADLGARPRRCATGCDRMLPTQPGDLTSDEREKLRRLRREV